MCSKFASEETSPLLRSPKEPKSTSTAIATLTRWFSLAASPSTARRCSCATHAISTIASTSKTIGITLWISPPSSRFSPPKSRKSTARTPCTPGFLFSLYNKNVKTVIENEHTLLNEFDNLCKKQLKDFNQFIDDQIGIIIHHFQLMKQKIAIFFDSKRPP